MANDYNDILNLYKNDFEEKKNMNCVVKGSFPIAWFGNIEDYFKSKKRILTIALNPSFNEFPKNERRFSNFNIDNNEKYYNDLNNYFYYNPYTKWFSGLEKPLNKLKCSYGGKMSSGIKYENTAIHIDYFTAIATNPTWSKLTAIDRQISNTKLFRQFFFFLKPEVVLISAKKENLSEIFGINNSTKILYIQKSKRGLTPNIEVYQQNQQVIIFGKNNLKPFMFSDEYISNVFEEISNIVFQKNS